MFFLVTCLLLASVLSHFECKSVEEPIWSRDSLVLANWRRNPGNIILSRAWRDHLLNGSFREHQGLHDAKEGSAEARNIYNQHIVIYYITGEG